MILKKLIKKLIDINVLIFVKILTQLRIGRYFLYKLNYKIISEKKSVEEIVGGNNLEEIRIKRAEIVAKQSTFIAQIEKLDAIKETASAGIKITKKRINV